MKFIKTAFVTAAIALTLGFSANIASAETIGVVDLDKVINSYTKAQNVSAELKVKEAELQKFLADAQKKLKDTASPLDRKNLEDKLTAEFKTKSDAYRNYQVTQMKSIEDNVFGTIEKIAKDQNVDVVINKAAVLVGGCDITDKVVTTLNASK